MRRWECVGNASRLVCVDRITKVLDFMAGADVYNRSFCELVQNRVWESMIVVVIGVAGDAYDRENIADCLLHRFVQDRCWDFIFDIIVYRDEDLVFMLSGINHLVILFKARAYGIILNRDIRFFRLVLMFSFVGFAIAMRPLNADLS
jgi:hypothetical protein